MVPISAAFHLYRGCQFYWWSTRRKPQTYRLSHDVVSSTPRHTITVPSSFHPILYLYWPHWLTKVLQFLGVPRDWLSLVVLGL
jgi:hypothetical protein